ncbi:helix-turn-helix domain-containing protein [Bacillus cereus]|nr:helix-turn-helix domain-containing protein [Bacillus cereus]MDA2572745.1 helix-turn-helix domain-containing protein [Bacillus cereus]
MSEKQKKHEVAFKDYLEGIKYKDIAEKHGVSINTVKSWIKRYNWKREGAPQSKKGCTKSTKKGATKKRVQTKTTSKNSKLREVIHQDLLTQLKDNGTIGAHYTDLVNDYMKLWDIKNNLFVDIEKRGVSVIGTNGLLKKNDSINELNKTNTQMLKILADLGLKATELEKASDTDDDEDV